MPETVPQQKILHALRLLLTPGVGPRTQQTLLEHYGSAEAVFQAGFSDWVELPGIGKKLASALQNSSLKAAEEEYERNTQAGVMLIHREDERYPPLLRETHDPPSVLFCRGDILPRDAMAVGIVGSRNCTSYGENQTHKLATALAAAGVTVISGLARGIDGVAHRAALNAGGRTFAVTATGMGTVYPPEHKKLAQEVSQQGAILTECPFGQAPTRGLFPQRNRIISGLSVGVIIVEAMRKSGALHTARHALEQGREVFAVPGRVDSAASEGCHDLLRDGATLIRNADDVIEALGPFEITAPAQPAAVAEKTSPLVPPPAALDLNEREQQVYTAITGEAQHLDEVLRQIPLPSSEVLSTLTILEMKRLVRRMPGGYLVRNDA